MEKTVWANPQSRVNLAAALVVAGKKVGVLDGEINGPDVPKIFGLECGSPESGPNGLLPVISLFNVKVMSMAFLIQADYVQKS